MRVSIENRSEAEIAGVTAVFREGYFVTTHSIPQCKAFKIPAKALTVWGTQIQLRPPVRVHFTDVNGRHWTKILQEGRDPNLRQKEHPSLNPAKNLSKLLKPSLSIGPLPYGCG
ncbi:hypothetical protein GCM10017771_73890 [Streptomyces capitiformicae]|uniref:Uncharacterized protein n=1 Tax=Streptomyces capitiformicae TaxID=2014920 RepID=A0A918ZGH9_9ACTN|nr:hypothetical protein GCM10017771_73890 [Streptomyces capitiformicae]